MKLEETIKYLLKHNNTNYTIATNYKKVGELNMNIFKICKDINFTLYKDVYTFNNKSTLRIIVVDEVY